MKDQISRVLSAILAVSSAFSQKAYPACPPFSGDLTVKVKNIYPESVDFSHSNCKIYVGSLNNGSIVEFDPYTSASEIIEIPGISHSDDYFVCGVDYSPATGTIYISASARAPWFPGFGEELTGPNRLINYSPLQRTILWQADIDPIVAQITQEIGTPFAGFQDSAEDKDGNAYFLAAFGNVLLKVDTKGKASEFYRPEPDKFVTAYGFGGSFVTKDNVLVLADAVSQGFVRFDLSSPNSSQPLYIAPSGHPENYADPLECDASRSFSSHGVIAVYTSGDGWKTSEYVGIIPVEFGQEPDVWSTAQFGTADRVYALSSALPYEEGIFPQTESTTLVDITEKVDELVRKSSQSGHVHSEL